ncbi:3D domain-containing protein [Patescibacteria group bacterium]|nr:3D domain-containing protein [Patescibacteria group bacterium]
MAITAYSSTVGETDSTPFITASGSTVREGIVANNLLPFGTKIMVPQLYGDKIFVVEDRMNRKKGNYHLDIWFSSYSEAKKFGAEIAYVEVLED